jgi:glutaredoxin
MKKYLLLLIALIFVIYGTANADFYKWEDEEGNVHITDYPPPDQSNKNIRIYKDESGSSKPAQDEEQGETAKDDKVKKEPDVILYTKNSCDDCDKARDFLKSKNIKFTEYNMDEDTKAVKKRKDIDDSDDVPFAIINKNHVYGFSESAYNRLLKLKP